MYNREVVQKDLKELNQKLVETNAELKSLYRHKEEEQNTVNVEKIEFKAEKLNMIENLSTHLDNMAKIFKPIEMEIDDLLTKKYHNTYQFILEYMDSLLSRFRSSMIIKKYNVTIDTIVQMAALNEKINSLMPNSNLHSYIFMVLNAWINNFLTILAEETYALLKLLKYPNFSASSLADQRFDRVLTKNQQTQLIGLFGTLLEIPFISKETDPLPSNTPYYNRCKLNPVTKLIDFKSEYPIALLRNVLSNTDYHHHNHQFSYLCIVLLIPFYRRFMYHFMSPSRKTTQIDKPEWFFSQILDWIRLNSPFLISTIQCTIDQELSSLKTKDFDIQFEFVQGLITIACNTRIRKDLTTIMDVINQNNQSSDDETDYLLGHLVDECISFQKSLSLYGYDLNCSPNCMQFMIDTKGFTTIWLELEHKSAHSKINSFISDIYTYVYSINMDYSASHESETNETIAWNIPSFLQDFLTFIDYYNERYEYICDNNVRLKLFSLQTELLDSFRCQFKDELERIYASTSDTMHVSESVELSISHMDSKQNKQDIILGAITLGINAFHTIIHDGLEKWELLPIFSLLTMLKKTTKAKSSSYLEEMDINSIDLDSTIFQSIISLFQSDIDNFMQVLVDCTIETLNQYMIMYNEQSWNNDLNHVYGEPSLELISEIVPSVSNVSPVVHILIMKIQCITMDLENKFGLYNKYNKSFILRIFKWLDSSLIELIMHQRIWTEPAIAQLKTDFQFGFSTCAQYVQISICEKHKKVLTEAYKLEPKTDYVYQLLPKFTEAIKLLTLNSGTALLLAENLVESKETHLIKHSLTNALKELNINHLSTNDIFDMLKKRQILAILANEF